MRIILTLLFLPLFIYAQDLAPSQMLLPKEALPEYEAKIDHARLIQDTSREALKTGQIGLPKKLCKLPWQPHQFPDKFILNNKQ